MAKRSRVPLLLTVAAAAWAIRKSAQGAYKAKVTEEVMKYRDTLYTVGPNCEIETKEGAIGGEDAGEELELLWTEFAYPIVKESWERSEWTLDEVTTAVMEKLFPEEQCVWPPVPDSHSTQKSAYYLMMVFISNHLACEPENQGAVPADQVCMTSMVSDEVAHALETAGVVLGMMAQGHGGVTGLVGSEGEYRVHFRAPVEAMVVAVMNNGARN